MTKDFRWPGVTAVLLAGAVFALAGCAAEAPTMPTSIEQKIENASSRQDHEELAAQYERQAGLDAAAAARHQGYAATYRRNRSLRGGLEAHENLAKHCDNLARTYQQAAAENLVMAKLQRDLAAGVAR